MISSEWTCVDGRARCEQAFTLHRELEFINQVNILRRTLCIQYYSKLSLTECQHYFQLEVVWAIKMTRGHVLLSLHTTSTAEGLCTLQDNGTVQHRHTSVSCSSKVCPDTVRLTI